MEAGFDLRPVADTHKMGYPAAISRGEQEAKRSGLAAAQGGDSVNQIHEYILATILNKDKFILIKGRSAQGLRLVRDSAACR
jgi:hypothetical protein